MNDVRYSGSCALPLAPQGQKRGSNPQRCPGRIVSFVAAGDRAATRARPCTGLVAPRTGTLPTETALGVHWMLLLHSEEQRLNLQEDGFGVFRRNCVRVEPKCVVIDLTDSDRRVTIVKSGD